MEDSSDTRRAGGVIDSLAGVARSLLAMLHTRLELLGVEFREEIVRLGAMLLWAYLAVFFATVGVLLIVGAVIIAVWDTHRVLALGLFGAVFLALGALTAWTLMRTARQKPRLFEASLGELASDEAHLRGERRA